MRVCDRGCVRVDESVCQSMCESDRGCVRVRERVCERARKGCMSVDEP